jgi:hypothetical protein
MDSAIDSVRSSCRCSYPSLGQVQGKKITLGRLDPRATRVTIFPRQFVGRVVEEDLKARHIVVLKAPHDGLNGVYLQIT